MHSIPLHVVCFLISGFHGNKVYLYLYTPTVLYCEDAAELQLSYVQRLSCTMYRARSQFKVKSFSAGVHSGPTRLYSR